MYKFSNKEHTAVTDITTGASGIHPGVWMWEAYHEWLKGGGVTEPFDTRTVQEIEIDDINSQKEAIAAERYIREIADLDYNGTFIFMDRDARTTLEQTMDKIRRGVIPSSPYKCRNGWITLTPANIEEIELAGVQHVLNAFMWEMAELQKLA